MPFTPSGSKLGVKFDPLVESGFHLVLTGNVGEPLQDELAGVLNYLIAALVVEEQAMPNGKAILVAAG